jgi:hypothetical protein
MHRVLIYCYTPEVTLDEAHQNQAIGGSWCAVEDAAYPMRTLEVRKQPKSSEIILNADFDKLLLISRLHAVSATCGDR